METTPSLACANKCVFCWRHHTNPVGKSWRWQMDAPSEIVTGALEQHTKMIKQMKGVPGNSAVFDFLRSTMGYSWDFGYSVQLM
jgi:wyosine [tRNA(Phe)-imidazoG37] synthetase (radical SAM superfamily)